jgi:hypothetical protein
MRNTYTVLVGKSVEKRPIGKRRRRWVNNIEMDLRTVGLDGVDWIHLAQDRDCWRVLVNTVTKLLVPFKAGNFLTS